MIFSTGIVAEDADLLVAAAEGAVLVVAVEDAGELVGDEVSGVDEALALELDPTGPDVPPTGPPEGWTLFVVIPAAD